MGCNNSSEREQDCQETRANQEYADTIMFLSKVPLLKRLPQDEHPLLATAIDVAEYKPGEVVIRQGDTGNELFVIKKGVAHVWSAEENSDAQIVAKLKGGDYFGENALLHEAPRNATIIAETALTTLKISRERFQHLKLHQKLQFAKRKAVVAGAQKTACISKPTSKSDEDVNLIVYALKENQNLQTMCNGQLDDARARQMADIAWKESVDEGVNLISEGDLEADYFYIVAEGVFEVLRAEDGDARTSQRRSVRTLTTGHSFGELALMYFAPRAATVTAVCDSTVWVMDRSNFKNILMKTSDDKIKQYEGYIGRVEIFNSLLAEERQAVAKALIETELSRNEVILKQGEEGNTFYILIEGAVSIVKDGAETGKLAASESGGIAQVFGERALLNNEPRAATVTVISERAKALVLDRESFNFLLGPLQDLISDRDRDGVPTASRALGHTGCASSSVNGSRKKILKKELSRIGLLGCGGFGVVELWAHKPTGNTYALKGISKGWIVKTGTQELVMNEKNILFRLNSPFIIQLHATYNGSQTLYFLLEAALGGELCATYRRKGFFGSHPHTKFYAAAVVFAFEHCHERRIIYRDLKPENLILTEHGTIKLADMGLAKFVIGKTYTTCGTPDYFSPEIIASSGHTTALDWWTLGILIFELLADRPPFEASNTMQIYSKIMKGIDVVKFPKDCTTGEVDVLIKGLLRMEPSDRLPVRSGGTQNIKDTLWYADFSWRDMESQTLEPPYKPEVKSNKDIANFAADKADMPTHLDYKDDGTGWDKDFAS